METSIACSLCGKPTAPEVLAEAHRYVFWQRPDGACPACVQQTLLLTLLDEGHAAFHERVQTAWPLDVDAAFGALPTPLRLHADPRFAGRGVTLAMVDSAFYPHPDLVQPRNRIRVWVDASRVPAREVVFSPDESPRWPGAEASADAQWHGTMTSVAAAGNGWLSHGLYRGLASEADLVLIQVRDEGGRITSASIERALRWLLDRGVDVGVRVVNLSVSGDPVAALAGNPIDAAIDELIAAGVTVVAAAGNDGQRRLLPPATAPAAITVGGIDDKNTFDHRELTLWHSNYGEGGEGVSKPELVAPSIWVAAPILPGTAVADEARRLFDPRRPEHEERMKQLKLISPHYQHADGTSFAAPIVASAVACMREANPGLSPGIMRDLLRRAASPVPGVSRERQGAGVLEAGRAVALALNEGHSRLPLSPDVDGEGVSFLLHDHDARTVRVLGSWNGWDGPGLPAGVEDGVWRTARVPLAAGRYAYKFLVDNARWLDDPANPLKWTDGFGGLNSVVQV